MKAPDPDAIRARHLVDDVRRFGLLSAATVVDRYTQMVERAVAHDPWMSAPSDATEPDPLGVAEATARLGQAYLAFVDSVAEILGSGRRDGHMPVERVVLPAAPPGGTSRGSLWVHNPTQAAADIEMEVTPLMSTHGVSLPHAAIDLSPGNVLLLPSGGSRELRIRVDVPPDQDAGHYHGLAFVSAAPDEPLVLALEVGEKVG